jgi:hypothetical protein
MRRISMMLLLAAVAIAFSAGAAPRHDICRDVGTGPAVGISSFSSAGDWLVEAHDAHGAHWRFVYVYLVPTDDVDGLRWFINHKAEVAASVGAIPVYTFYQLLQIGQNAGLSGSEPEIVQAVMGSDALMRDYFDNFVVVLQTLAGMDGVFIVHVEPDSWGFMMWAMGVEGNDDPESVPARVDGSGHPDTAGFADHAAGFGQALVHLRDLHAPEVRLGWHASNFRAGTRPEVVSSFFAGMGDWDVLFGEHPHNEADESSWWEPWDEARVSTNLAWFQAVTASARIPIILWQLPIGSMDWHLWGDDNDHVMIGRFAEAGVAGFLFEHQGSGDNPDEFRALGELGAVPPSDSGAGGTAAHMRDRVAAYSADPAAWPAGSLCTAAAPDPDETEDIMPADAEAEDDALVPDAGEDPMQEPDDNGGDGGCGCSLAGI